MTITQSSHDPRTTNTQASHDHHPGNPAFFVYTGVDPRAGGRYADHLASLSAYNGPDGARCGRGRDLLEPGSHGQGVRRGVAGSVA